MSYQDAIEFEQKNAEEIKLLNERLDALRAEMEKAFKANGGVNDVIEELEESGWAACDRYDHLAGLAASLGMGFSYEDGYLWQPSTRSC